MNLIGLHTNALVARWRAACPVRRLVHLGLAVALATVVGAGALGSAGRAEASGWYWIVWATYDQVTDYYLLCTYPQAYGGYGGYAYTLDQRDQYGRPFPYSSGPAVGITAYYTKLGCHS